MDKKTSKNNKKKRAFLVIAGAFAAVFVFSAIMLTKELKQSKAEEQTFTELSALKAQYKNIPSSEKEQTQSHLIEPAASPAQNSEDIGLTQEEQSENNNNVENTDQKTDDEPAERALLQQYVQLSELNQELFGWITIPDTNIDYPVMYSPTRPNYYLNHDYYGNVAYTGVPYMDKDCNPDGSYYLVYGHHPNLGTMFSHIVDYQEKSFWETHQEILFDTLYEERTYIVAAAFKAKVVSVEDRQGFRYYNYKSLDTESLFDEYIQQVKGRALYDTGISLSFGDELLVLSTCYHYVSNGRFVVIAKRVS